MPCCVLFAFVFGLLARGWQWATRSAPAPELFAPPASRPGPGAAPAVAPAPAHVTAPRSPRRAWMFWFGAVGVASYVAAIALLTTAGAADDHGEAWAWVVRTVVFATITVVALRTAASRPRLASNTEVAACALIALGLTWFELGMIDMHMFSLFELAGGALFWDVVFHGAGPAAAAIGWLLLPVRATRATPSYAS